MADRSVVVKLIGDERDLNRALRASERNVATFQGRVQAVGRDFGRSFIPAAAGVAAGAFVTRELGRAVSNASDLNEELSKSEQVFGSAASEVQSWAKTTARSIGIARSEALQAAGSFGALFTNLGVIPDQAAEMSRTLVQLAADLGSLNNASAGEVLVALRSGLIGEAEPLRRFQIFLSAARVEQAAMAATGKTNARALTDQEKALARFNLILQDGAIASGNFAATSGDLAQRQKILQANLTNLSASLGTLLVPTLEDATGAANQLFIALDKFRGQDFSPGFSGPGLPGGVGRFARNSLFLGPATLGLGPPLLELSRQFQDEQDDATKATGAVLRSERGAEAVDNLRAAAREREQKAAAAARDLERSRKRFAELLLGLGLKLDTTRLAGGNEVAVLREMERAIQRRIQSEGRSFKLVEQLTAVRLEIAAAVDAQAQEAQRRSQDAWNNTLEALELRLDAARMTKSLQDDQQRLREIEQAIQRRIRIEGEIPSLMRQLLDVRRQQDDVAKQMAENARNRRQGRQFEALGLTAEGQQRVPGTGALQRRVNNLREQVKGTILDTPKTAAMLDQIERVLSGKFGKVGRNVREAILGMLNDITSALEGGDRSMDGQITPGGIRPLARLTAGLGLSEQQLAEMERRMNRRRKGRPVNAFGFDFDGTPTLSTGQLQGRNQGLPSTVVQVFIDGKQVAPSVVKQMQKTGKRRTNRRGGPNAGRGAVL